MSRNSRSRLWRRSGRRFEGLGRFGGDGRQGFGLRSRFDDRLALLRLRLGKLATLKTKIITRVNFEKKERDTARDWGLLDGKGLCGRRSSAFGHSGLWSDLGGGNGSDTT